LLHYQLFYPDAPPWSPISKWANIPRPPSRPICINLASDVLYFFGIDGLEYATEEGLGLEGVQVIAIRGLNISDYWLLDSEDNDLSIFEGFPSLKKLILIASSAEEDGWMIDETESGGEAFRLKVLEYMKELQLWDPARTVPEVLMLPAWAMTNALCYI